MSATSGLNLLQLCRLITTEDCQNIFNQQWQWQEPTFNAIVIINRMHNNVSQHRVRWRHFISQENDSMSLKNELLDFVAQCRGEVLHAFLLALQKEPDDLHLDLQKDMEITVGGYACQSSALDVNLLLQTSSSRKLLKEDLTAEERQLIVCANCDNVMDDPVLLECLHSFCRKCAGSSCCTCGRRLKGITRETNLYILNRIAAAVKQTTSQNKCHSNGCRPQEDEHSPSDRTSCEPMCMVHNHEMKFWCSDCNKFCCDTYVSMNCGKSKHAYSVIFKVARNVKKWMQMFSSCKQKPDITDNITSSVPALHNPNTFTQKYMRVLEEKERLLSSATRSAIDDARDSIERHHKDFLKEADEIIEQVTQADLYFKSFRHDHYFYMFHQRKLLSQQIRLLLNRTGYASQCSSLDESAALDFSCADPPDSMCDNVKRLLIECLPDSYNSPLSKELVGSVKVTETDSPVHLFWVDNHSMTKEKEKLTLVAEIESQAESWRTKFLDAERTVQTLQQRLNDTEKEFKERQAKVASEFTNSVGDGGLEEHLRKTMPFIITHMSKGDVAEVLDHLWSKSCILERDLQNVKSETTTIKQAEALIEVIRAKGPFCQKAFLRILRKNVNRQELVDVILSGKNPDDCC